MHTDKPAKVLIVDDHPLVRAGLRQLVMDESDFEVCGEASGAREAMQIVRKYRPHLAIIDMSLSDGSGLTLIRRMLSVAADVRILVVSMHDDSVFAERALQAGAMGYLNKQEAAGKVITALRRVRERKMYLRQGVMDRLVRQSTANKAENRPVSPIERLSDREVEVFEFLGRGFGTAQIAEKLNLSVKTIESYRTQIKRKLKFNSANELIVRAAQWILETNRP